MTLENRSLLPSSSTTITSPLRGSKRRLIVGAALLSAVALCATVLVAGPARADDSDQDAGAAASALTRAASIDRVVAYDAMNRSVQTGWGTAGAGGAYRSAPAGLGGIDKGWASLTSPGPGRMALMTLDDVDSLDTLTRIDVNVPALPASGSTVYAAHHARVGGEGSYAVQLGIRADGSSVLSILRMEGGIIDAPSASLASGKGPTVRPGRPISLVLSVAGTDEVLVSAKAWEVGAQEPGNWSLSATDTGSARVAGSGAVAVTSYAGSGGDVTPVRFDNLVVRSSAGTSAPTPKPPTTEPEPPTTEPKPPTEPEPPTTEPKPQDPSTDPSASVDYPGKRFDAGAAAPGTVSYPVPADAVFVATDGSDSNPGTIDRPLATLTKASQVVKENGTVVLRGGTYHEDVLVYPRRGITIQPYLTEAVWFDGAETVTGWTRSGNVWVKSGWTTFFDSSPTFVKGAADGTDVGYVWLNPAYPLAAHPDQIWVDGVPLTQVGSRAQVGEGTFFVDRAGRQLVLGTDPAGKRVEASTLQKALSIRAEDSTVRGIGVRRYATSMPEKGTVTADYPGITLENVTIIDNATTGFHTWAADVSLENVTAAHNGYMGFSAHKADGFTADSVLSYENNTQHFNRTPGSGAMKVTTTKDVTIRDSSFIGNWGQGVWFDDSAQDIVFTGNDVVGNEGNGLVLEISERATVADNLIADSGIAGVFVTNTGNVAIWNNTFVGNKRNINIAEDDRRGSASGMPWVTKNVSLVNNVVAGEAGADCVVCVESWSKKLTGDTMLTQSEGNLFHRPGSSSPKWFALWANGAGGSTGYATFEAYAAATGRDGSSTVVQGASPVDEDFALTSSYADRVSSARPIPASIAAVSNLREGSRLLGARTTG
ncbi:right-handed parallel beta-helix repeat-containing protein [Microbacterium tumbae]